MSLRVWLPLNGDLRNNGLSDITVTNNGATVDNNGKIGKCYSFGTASSYLILPNEDINNCTTECSISFWLNIISWNTAYATYFQAGLGGTPWTHYIFGVLRNNQNSNLCFTISNGSSASNASYTTSNLELNTWYHLAFVYKTGHCLIYINGSLYKDYATTIVPDFSAIIKTTIGTSNNITNYQTNCKLNDVRIYDHALSAKEVKEISKGLVAHYPLIRNSINLVDGSNTKSLYFNYSEQTGGSTRTIEYDNGIPCTKITRNSTEHSGWAYLNYTNLRKTEIKPSTIYTVSFDIMASGDGVIGFSGFMAGNATNNLSKTTSAIQNSFSANSWSHIILQTTTKDSFDDLTVGSQVVYMGCSYLNNINVWAKFKNMKVEEGTKDTKWSPSPNDVAYSLMGYNSNRILDTSGNNYNLTINGTPICNTDSPRNSACTNFVSPSNAYCTTFTPTGYTNSYSIAFWAVYTNNGMAFAHANGNRLNLWFNSGKILWNTGDGGNNPFQNNGTDISNSAYLNFWHHYVITADGTSNKLYIDGKYVGTAKTFKPLTGTTLVLSGWTTDTSTSYRLNGSISDFRLYSTALSADDIKQLYNTPISIAKNSSILTQGEYIE